MKPQTKRRMPLGKATSLGCILIVLITALLSICRDANCSRLELLRIYRLPFEPDTSYHLNVPQSSRKFARPGKPGSAKVRHFKLPTPGRARQLQHQAASQYQPAYGDVNQYRFQPVGVGPSYRPSRPAGDGRPNYFHFSENPFPKQSQASPQTQALALAQANSRLLYAMSSIPGSSLSSANTLATSDLYSAPFNRHSSPMLVSPAAAIPDFYAAPSSRHNNSPFLVSSAAYWPGISPSYSSRVPATFARQYYAEPLKTRQRCAYNEVHRECMNQCQDSCFERYCTSSTECVSGCECVDGYSRDLFGQCIPRHNCPQNPCGANAVFRVCGTACPETCDWRPLACNQQCMPGCFCVDGYVKSSKDGTCIPRSACPMAEKPKSKSPASQSAKGFRVELSCGQNEMVGLLSCERTCSAPEPGPTCITAVAAHSPTLAAACKDQTQNNYHPNCLPFIRGCICAPGFVRPFATQATLDKQQCMSIAFCASGIVDYQSGSSPPTIWKSNQKY